MTKDTLKKLFPVYFVVFIDNFGWSIAFTLITPLILKSSYGIIGYDVSDGLRSVLLGIMFAAFPLTQFFGAPIIGDIADRFGRKKAFYVSITGISIGFALSAIAVLCHSYFFLLITRLICGFFAGNLTVCLAAISDISPTEEERSKNFGYLTMVLGVAWIFAMIIGGYLANPHYLNPSVPFWITAILSLISLYFIFLLFEETNQTNEKFKLHINQGIKNVITCLRIESIRPLYLVYFFWVMGWALSIQWFNPIALDYFHESVVSATWVLVFLGITWSLAASYVNSYLSVKYHSHSISKVCFVILTIGLLFSAFSPNFTFLAIVFTITAIFAALSMTNVLNHMSLKAPKEIQGKVMGLSQSAMSLGFFIGPILGGIIGAFDIRVVYFFTTFFMAIGMVLNLFYKYQEPKKHNSKSAAKKNKNKS